MSQINPQTTSIRIVNLKKKDALFLDGTADVADGAGFIGALF